jgi:hypothetical protein
MIKKRFYNGTILHWFSRITNGTLEIRLIAENGVRHVNLVDFEFPTLDNIKGLKCKQLRAQRSLESVRALITMKDATFSYQLESSLN